MIAENSMRLIEYLGHKLKDDDMLDLLESNDMDIVYSIDRLHENLPDSYTSSSKQAGFELLFDDAQVLTTIFCFLAPNEDYQSIDRNIIGVPIHKSPDIAKAAGARAGAIVKCADKVEFMGQELSWVRIHSKNIAVHYEYSSGMLTIITLMLHPPS